MAFNVLNALKYPKEVVVDCLLNSSWETIIQKQLMDKNKELKL